MDYLSLLIPIAYLSILLGSLATFSSLYRARKLRRTQSLAPYFPPHTSRNVYLSLVHQQDHNPSSAPIPKSVLRAALLLRAVEDIHRIMELRTRKQALAQLLQKGVVGDEIWQRLLRAEQEIELEVRDVVSEANGLSGGQWGQTIFQSASEMAANKMFRERLERVRSTLPKDKEEWERTREEARKELEAEIGTDDKHEKSKPAAETSQAAAAVTTPEKSKAGSSDEDAVLVEPPAEEGPGVVGESRGKSKKKRGKKSA